MIKKWYPVRRHGEVSVAGALRVTTSKFNYFHRAEKADYAVGPVCRLQTALARVPFFGEKFHFH
jgi:hypothetical protein